MVRAAVTITALSAAFAGPSIAAPATSTTAKYSLIADYSGNTFFNNFDFFTGADPTMGNVTYVDAATAAQNEYAGFIVNELTNSTNVYIGVNYKDVQPMRDSVRLSSKQTFDVGSIIVMDVVHVPSAYGSWPALWMLGDLPGEWPTNGGEIDIFEVVHEGDFNSMTLHTGPGCDVENSTTAFQGTLQNTNCNAGDASDGCSIQALRQDKLQVNTMATAGKAFNAQGGGVYVTVWTTEGISVYLFSRSALPADLAAGAPSPSSWTTTPLARFSGPSCDYAQTFQQMKIITDQTWCGAWAGQVWESSGAANATGVKSCNEYVMDNPAAFKDTYFEIAGIKVYSSNSSVPAASKREVSEDGYNFSTIVVQQRHRQNPRQRSLSHVALHAVSED